MTHLVLHTDGGARGNPGPAAIGVVVEAVRPGGRESLAEIGEKIGVATNNIAEYRALIRGLEEAGRFGADQVDCLLDSQLVVEQMNGRFKVKHENVVPLHRQATELSRGFKKVTFAYVPRAQNAGADALVNAALDGKLAARQHGPARQEEFVLDQPPTPEAGRATPLELVRRAYRDAVEVPRAPLESLNRGLPPGLRYDSEAQAWRELWTAATADGRFAVACGLATAAELAELEAEFAELRPA